MQEVFEKIIEKFTSKIEVLGGASGNNEIQDTAVKEIMWCADIVKQEAEEFATDTNVGSNGWIPVSERLPDEAFGCLVTVMNYEPSTQTEFENILQYFVGYDGQSWNNADGEEIPFEVVAWKQLPAPYQTKGE